MNNFDTAVSATSDAMNSAGSAANENEKYMQSMEAKLSNLSSTWQEFSTNVVNSDLAKGIVDLGNVLLKLADNDFTKIILVFGSTLVAMNLLKKGTSNLAESFKEMAAKQLLMRSGISMLTKEQLAAEAANLSLGKSFNILTTSMLANPLFWGAAAVAGIYAIGKGMEWVIGIADRYYAQSKKAVEEQEELLDGINSKIDELKTKMKEINNSDYMTIVEETELENLKKQTKELLTQKKIEEETLALREKKAQKAGDMVIGNKLRDKAYYNPNESFSLSTEGYGLGTQNLNGRNSYSESLNIEQLTSEYEKFINLQKEAKENGTSLDNSTISYGQKLKESLSKANVEFSEVVSNTDTMSAETAENVEKLQSKIYSLLDPKSYKSDKVADFLDSKKWKENDLYDEIKKIGLESEMTESKLNELRRGTSDLSDYLTINGISSEEAARAINDYYRGLVEASTESQNLITTNKELTESLTEISDEMDSLNSALLEQAENGSVSLDTMLSLIENGYATALSIDEQTGAIELNAEATKALVAAKLLDLQIGYQDQIDTLTASLKNSAIACAVSAEAELARAEAVAVANQKTQEEINTLKLQKQAISNLYGQIGNIGTASYKPSSYKSSNSSSSKEWWENELETLKDQYKYNELTISEYINSLGSLLGRISYGTEAWKQINEELQKQKITKIEDDYKRNKISITEYIAQLKNLLGVYKSGSEDWLNIIDKINSAQKELLDNTKEQYDSAKNAASSLIDEQISKIENLRDETEKYYDDLISAKEDANSETEKEIKLAELQEALYNAQTQRNQRVYIEGVGFTWKSDSNAIKEAQDSLNEYQKEQEIVELEKQKENALKELDNQIDSWNKYKESWDNIADEYELQQDKIILVQTLGADAEAAILQKRIDVLNAFRNQYVNILRDVSSFSGSNSVSNATGGTSLSSNIPGFSNGGVVDYTGYAKVHGSFNRPEIMLNNNQASNLYSMLNRPRTESLFKGSGSNSSVIYNFDSLVLPNVTNSTQFINELKSRINITNNQ